MAKLTLNEQFDRAVEAILSNPAAATPQVDAKLAALLALAIELRGFPSEDFKSRLKADLERSKEMGTPESASQAVREKAAEKPPRVATGAAVAAMPGIREGFHTVTPYLMAHNAVELLEFVKQTFGAAEVLRTQGPAGGMHAEVRMGDSMLMIGGGGSWKGTPMPTGLHVYVPDTDALYRRALEAGGKSLHEPMEQDYGERSASVKDISGNHWYIATHHGPSHVPEGLRTVNVYLHPRGAGHLIDFLKQAFRADEIARYADAAGTIQHASVRIGDSVIEMGEAHGPYQPMPTAIYLYVSDVDTVYERAVEAGGTSMQKPADQPYGDRSAHIEDPFGNVWYIATHIKPST